MCARQFLAVVFVLILLVVVGAFAIFQFGDRVLIKSAIPHGHFEAATAGSGPDYSDPGNWVARPGLANDPSEWLPEGMATDRSRRCRRLLRPPHDISRTRSLERAIAA